MHGLLTAYVYAMSIVGWPFVASLLALIAAPESSLQAIAMRTSVGLAAVCMLWRFRDRFRFVHPGASIAFVVFWSAYLGRYAYDAWVVERFSYILEPRMVLVMILLFMIAPTTAMLFGLGRRNAAATHSVLTILTVVTALILLYQSAEVLARMAEQSRGIRFQFDKLNPISVGHLGATLLLLACIGLTNAAERGRLFVVAGTAVGIVGGLYIMVIAASKGPVVSAAFALVVYWAIPVRVARLCIGSAVCALLYFGVLELQVVLVDEFDFDIFDRFTDVLDGESRSVDGRIGLMTRAWAQFLESPIVGSSLFESQSQYYPHNMLVEAFMATGLVGGLAYVYIVCIALISAVRLLALHDGREWIAVLGIYYFLSGMFSGSHYAYSPPWVAMIALIATASLVDGNESLNDERAPRPTIPRRKWWKRLLRSRGRRRPSAMPTARVLTGSTNS